MNLSVSTYISLGFISKPGRRPHNLRPKHLKNNSFIVYKDSEKEIYEFLQKTKHNDEPFIEWDIITFYDVLVAVEFKLKFV